MRNEKENRVVRRQGGSEKKEEGRKKCRENPDSPRRGKKGRMSITFQRARLVTPSRYNIKQNSMRKGEKEGS